MGVIFARARAANRDVIMSERRRHALPAWIFAEPAATIHAAEQGAFRAGTGRIIDPEQGE
jgi:hypothetical protein